MTAAPEAALSYLQKRLEPVKAMGRPSLERLIADLDDEQFATREEASRQLERLGPGVSEPLRQAMKGKLS
jgi:hypothetical protein